MPKSIELPRLISPHEAAAALGMKVETLNQWRAKRRGPAFVKVSNRCVRYDPAEIARWISERQAGSEAAR